MVTLPIAAISAGPHPVRALHLACSRCGSDEIYRQRPRGLIERHIFRAFQFAPFWCAACDVRFYVRIKGAAPKERPV